MWLLPRVNPGDAKAPLVCHVLNRDFDAAAERLVPQSDVKVRLSNNLLKGRGGCQWFAPSQEPQTLPVRRVGKDVEVTLPLLDAWAVLRFE